MLEGYVKDNYYARFDTHSYHSCRETDFNARVNIKLQSHWSVKCRSRTPGHSVCLKGMLRTMTMQGLTLAAIIAAEKQTLMLESMQNYVISFKSHWSVKCRSRAPGHSACLKDMLRTITMQGLTLAAIMSIRTDGKVNYVAPY